MSRNNMDTAPRDGTEIIVGHEDCGEFIMVWKDIFTNHLVSDKATGMWVATDQSFTWYEDAGYGPSYWRH